MLAAGLRIAGVNGAGVDVVTVERAAGGALPAAAGLGALQSTAAPPPQVPAWQRSPVVQVLWSSQGVPSGSDVPPLQLPARHVSLVVQVLPVLHGVPSVAAGLVHRPLSGAQVPARWH